VPIWFDRDDLKGVSCEEPPSIEPRPLRDGSHFVWLARFQLGKGWNHVTTDVDVQTVRSAVKDLPTQLRLELRPTRRGRPARATT
jgi:hypothetical protein